MNQAATVDTKACPVCAESIKAQATVCRFCGFDYTALLREPGTRHANAERGTVISTPFGPALSLVGGLAWGIGIFMQNVPVDPATILLFWGAPIVAVTCAVLALTVVGRISSATGGLVGIGAVFLLRAAANVLWSLRGGFDLEAGFLIETVGVACVLAGGLIVPSTKRGPLTS